MSSTRSTRAARGAGDVLTGVSGEVSITDKIKNEVFNIGCMDHDIT